MSLKLKKVNKQSAYNLRIRIDYGAHTLSIIVDNESVFWQGLLVYFPAEVITLTA